MREQPTTYASARADRPHPNLADELIRMLTLERGGVKLSELHVSLPISVRPRSPLTLAAELKKLRARGRLTVVGKGNGATWSIRKQAKPEKPKCVVCGGKRSGKSQHGQCRNCWREIRLTGRRAKQPEAHLTVVQRMTGIRDAVLRALADGPLTFTEIHDQLLCGKAMLIATLRGMRAARDVMLKSDQGRQHLSPSFSGVYSLPTQAESAEVMLKVRAVDVDPSRVVAGADRLLAQGTWYDLREIIALLRRQALHVNETELRTHLALLTSAGAVERIIGMAADRYRLRGTGNLRRSVPA